MIAAAVFSHGPWDGSAFDEVEDLLHSAASFGVGLFFTVGVVLVAVRRVDAPGWSRIVDGLALTAAMVIPLLMANIEAGGLVQRTNHVPGRHPLVRPREGPDPGHPVGGGRYCLLTLCNTVALTKQH